MDGVGRCGPLPQRPHTGLAAGASGGSPSSLSRGLLLQGGPEVVDLVAEPPYRGPDLGLQALALGPTNIPGADPRLLEQEPQVLQLGDPIPYFLTPAHRRLNIS